MAGRPATDRRSRTSTAHYGLDVHDVSLLADLAKKGREFLRSVRGVGRFHAVTTPPPSPGDDVPVDNPNDAADRVVVKSEAGDHVALDPLWLERYGHESRLHFAGAGVLAPLTDEDLLEIARKDRTLLARDPFKRCVSERLDRAAIVFEPSELERLRAFFVGLGHAIHPPRQGQPHELEPARVRELYRAQVEARRRIKATYRKTHIVPPPEALPVVEDPYTRSRGQNSRTRRGRLVTIEHRNWATVAAWVFVAAVLQEKVTTLQKLIKPSRAKVAAGH